MAETSIWRQPEDDSEFKPLDVHEFMERAVAENFFLSNRRQKMYQSK